MTETHEEALSKEVRDMIAGMPPVPEDLLQGPPEPLLRILRANPPDLSSRNLPDGIEIEECTAAAGGLAVPVRLYRPANPGPHPILLHFHGGGWVGGTRASDEERMLAVTRKAGCAVVSVGYRLAPEHPFPAAINDALAVQAWLKAQGRDLGLDCRRIAVSGSSAGGSIAVALAMSVRDSGDDGFRFLWLVNPALDCRMETDSYRQFARGPLLTRPLMSWFWRHYGSCAQTARSRLYSPASAGDVSGLPPTLIQVAACDVLRDEGIAFARKIAASGGKATADVVPDTAHGFMIWGLHLDHVQRALDKAVSLLEARLK